MTNLLESIAVSTDKMDELLAAAEAAGKAVGSRETKRANLFVVKTEDGGVEFRTTFAISSPHIFAINLASVRWSDTQKKYVVTENEFLGKPDGMTPSAISLAMLEGLDKAKTAYDATVEAEKAERAAKAQAAVIGGNGEFVLPTLIYNVNPGYRLCYFKSESDANVFAETLSKFGNETEVKIESAKDHYIVKTVSDLFNADPWCVSLTSKKEGAAL